MQFIDLKTQYSQNKADIDAAISDVLDHGRYIMGPEVKAFEDELAAFSGASNVVSCANGTDALQLALMSEEIGTGDAVFIPSFTFTATAEAALVLGATPVFCDIDADTFNIDIDSLQKQIDRTRADGDLRPAAVIAVDLFGLPASYAALNKLCAANELVLISDAAQSCGAVSENRRVGSLAPITTTSFFPAKPLGCYGDGGAVFTDDADRADRLRSLRAHGKGGAKYDIVRVGMNSRLDTIQAAILREKLKIFPGELESRKNVASRYSEGLRDFVVTPHVQSGVQSAWAQYTILTPHRDALVEHLKSADIPTAIYYPLPMHLQTAYRCFGQGEGSLPVSERCSREAMSLPMHPYLDASTQDQVIESVRQFFKNR